MSFFLIWPAIAALFGAVLLFVLPDASGAFQVSVFAILSVILTFAGRYLLNRFGDGGAAANTLNARASLMVGRQGEVLDFRGTEGHVIIDGVRWRAKWPDGAVAETGQSVRIEGAEGMTLFVAGPTE